MNNSIFRNYSIQQLDEQYNNRARVPEFEEYLKRWEHDSERVRQASKVREDIAYGTGEREKLDIFPARRPDSPVIVFIHGGYWQLLDKSRFSFIAPPLIEKGLTVIVLNYPLCPAVKLKDIVQSLRWAMVFLYRNLRKYNGDPERINIVGHSAGGHLVAMLLATPWRELDSSLQDGFIENGVSISGLFELEPIRHTFVNEALKLDQSEIDELSPISLAAPSKGKLDLFVGARESEEFKRQSADFAKTWSTAEFQTHYEELAGQDHFSIVDEIVNPKSSIHKALCSEPG
ncbi:MAG: alpha/beta hydrolase [Arenicellales bacterium]|nr:alpha/beta hydrolase [Arenicellales bacterium]